MSSKTLTIKKVVIEDELDGPAYLKAKSRGTQTSFVTELSFNEAVRIYSKAWVVRQLEALLQTLKSDS